MPSAVYDISSSPHAIDVDASPIREGKLAMRDNHAVESLSRASGSRGPIKRTPLIDIDDTDDDIVILPSPPPLTASSSNLRAESSVSGSRMEGFSQSGTSGHGMREAQTGEGQIHAETAYSEEVALAKVLDFVPDVELSYATSLCQRFFDQHKTRTHEVVIHHLLEESRYPKLERKRKKPEYEQEDPKGKAKEAKIDYTSLNRNGDGLHYKSLSLAHLHENFPSIPSQHIRKVFSGVGKGLYAPSYFQLEKDNESRTPSFRKRTYLRKSVSKSHYKSDYFEAERLWVAEQRGAPVDNPQEVDPAANIECGCCFGEYAFEEMVQCPEAHLFCKECARRHAEEAIGNRKVDIVCMDQSGCKEHFHRTEVARFLPEKMITLWERIKQEKSIQEAAIDGLESCPFCPYSVVIENDEEKLFRCENEECYAISCRACKKLDHLPKSCKEVEEDKKLDARHVIEEAMTAALTRKCPTCSNSFIKTDGCNKMTCPSCRTLSCYLCRQVIRGYEHFSQRPPNDGPRRNSTKCELWDAVERRGHDEVAQAAYAALEKYKAENPEAEDSDIDIKTILPDVPNLRNMSATGNPIAGPNHPYLQAPRPGLPMNLPRLHQELQHQPLPAPADFPPPILHHNHVPNVHPGPPRVAQRPINPLPRRMNVVAGPQYNPVGWAVLHGVHYPPPLQRVPPPLPVQPPAVANFAPRGNQPQHHLRVTVPDRPPANPPRRRTSPRRQPVAPRRPAYQPPDLDGWDPLQVMLPPERFRNLDVVPHPGLLRPERRAAQAAANNANPRNGMRAAAARPIIAAHVEEL